MNKWLVLILFLAGSTACQRTEPRELNVQHDSQYSITDSTNKTNHLMVFDTTYRVAYYPVYYMGETGYTYNLPSQPITSNWRDQVIDTTLKTARWSAKTIKIFVDTALDISYKRVYSHIVYKNDVKVQYETDEFVTDSVERIKAYPIFLTNTSDSTLYLGRHNYLNFMVREVKNDQGQWIGIEHFGRSFECNKCRIQFLKPHEVLIAKLLRYKGNFRATCRLRFGTRSNIVYSNTFTDNIDKRMLVPVTPFGD